MEIKSLIHMITWGVIDGLAAVWVLQLLWKMFGDGTLIQSLLLMSRAMCG